MSKKKHRQKAKRSSPRKPRGYHYTDVRDRHHCCFIGAQWSRGYAKKVRDFHYCIALIPKDTLHKRIHARVAYVPVPDDESAKYVYERLLLLDELGALKDRDPLEYRLLLLAALFSHKDATVAQGFFEQLAIVSDC